MNTATPDTDQRGPVMHSGVRCCPRCDEPCECEPHSDLEGEATGDGYSCWCADCAWSYHVTRYENDERLRAD